MIYQGVGTMSYVWKERAQERKASSIDRREKEKHQKKTLQEA